MNKDTIELRRNPRHWFNYGMMTSPFSQDGQSTLDALMEWAQNPLNQDKKVYRHLLRISQERIGEDGKAYDHVTDTWADRKDSASFPYDIPFCDLVYYLDIYWQ